MTLDGRPLSSWIETWAAHRPHAEALSFESRTWTYPAFAAEVRRWVALLDAEYGIGTGDRVGYLGHNHPTQLFVFFACARLGAAMVPFNWRLTEQELAYQLADSEPVVVVAAEPFRSLVGDWPTIGLGATSPTGGKTLPHRHDPGTTGRPGDAALIVYTSGTTGHPKGAVLDQRAILATALNGAFAHDFTCDDRVLTVLPLFHVGGLCIQTLPALFAGGAVRLHGVFDPGAWLDDVETWQATTSLLVPTTMAAITQHPSWPRRELGSLRGVMTGSSVVPEALMRPFHERAIPCGQVYGATETGPTTLVLRFADAIGKAGSCGKAVPHAAVRLVDAEGRDVAPGERGEVVVRGPNVLRGYWRNPEATAASFIDGTWFRTGDIGHRDEGGWWYIDDRSKDVIISGGENIYPAELEAILAESGAIAEAAVVGRPDAHWGEVAVAVVVAKPGADLAAEDVRELFAGRLARFKHPREVLFVDSLPRNVMGKVQRYRLREQVGPGAGERVS